ncbi:MAG: hypothetical protein ACRDQU_02990 [Pseudonocardiaceae bacterium]
MASLPGNPDTVGQLPTAVEVMGAKVVSSEPPGINFAVRPAAGQLIGPRVAAAIGQRRAAPGRGTAAARLSGDVGAVSILSRSSSVVVD